jgi:hypothetical protein
MYRVSLTGAGVASAYWPFISLEEAAERVKRWQSVLDDRGVEEQPLAEGWQIILEKNAGEGHWNIVARFDGGKWAAT